MKIRRHNLRKGFETFAKDRAERGVFYFIKQGVIDYLKPYWREQLTILITVVVLVGFEVSLPLFVKYLIDTVLVDRNQEFVVYVLLALSGFGIVAALALWWQAHVSVHSRFALGKDLRCRFFASVQRLPTHKLDMMQPGQMMSLFAKELNYVINTYGELMLNGSQSVIMLVAILITLFILNKSLALIILFFVPFLFLVPNIFLNKAIKVASLTAEEFAKIDFALQDNIATQPLLRALRLNNREIRRFKRKVLHMDDISRGVFDRKAFAEVVGSFRFLQAMVSVSATIQQYVINILVIIVGAYLVFTDSLTLGAFSGFVLLIPKVGKSTAGLSSFLRSLIQATTSLHRVENIFRMGGEDKQTESKKSLNRFEEFSIENVGFSYKPEMPILNNINLVVSQKQTLALLGRSGSGKSTFFKLMAGCYMPGKGAIKVNGNDLFQYDHETVGKICGVVFQENNLVNGTVRDNIALVKPDASLAEVETAARTVGIHGFIQQLPQGYDTPVGEQGKLLAGGERKRIALARAILHNPDVLLLDDLSADLDPESEEKFSHSIRKLSQHCAVIYSTHRLSSALQADKIAVLDHGEIKEIGSHEELLSKGGIYSQFWQVQNGFSVTQGGRHAEVTGERLQRIPLFSQLESKALDWLAEKFESEFFNGQEVIYQQGDHDHKFYILVRGLVTITALNSNRQEVALATLQDGEYFGEMELFNRGHRGTTVKTRTPTLCLTLGADVFEEITKEFSSLHRVMRQMALGRSLTTLSSVGRQSRKHPIWQELKECS